MNSWIGSSCVPLISGAAQIFSEITGLYENRDPFIKSAFVMQGHEDGIITFGRSIEEAELTLYSIIHKHLTT